MQWRSKKDSKGNVIHYPLKRSPKRQRKYPPRYENVQPFHNKRIQPEPNIILLAVLKNISPLEVKCAITVCKMVYISLKSTRQDSIRHITKRGLSDLQTEITWDIIKANSPIEYQNLMGRHENLAKNFIRDLMENISEEEINLAERYLQQI